MIECCGVCLRHCQWSVWEIIFMYGWGSGRLPYIRDEEFFGSQWARAIGWTLIIPLWREFHFYCAL